MGYLSTRSSKPNARGSQSGAGPRGKLAQGGAAYNRSSLALDVQEDGAALAWQPMPQLVPPAAGAAASSRGMFRSADLMTYRRSRKSSTTSFVLHVFIIGGLLWWTLSAQKIVHVPESVVHLNFPLTDPPPPVMPVARQMGGGGGGGEHKMAPPVKAPPPPYVPRIHLMPAQIAKIEKPKLAAEPTSQVNMKVATNMPTIGMPDSTQIALASQGSGAHSGFGSGMGGGIGVGNGSGTGVGGGGGFGGGVMSVGGGVSAPEVIHSVEPEFTEEARKANFQGTVSIQLIVDPQGNPQDVRVLRRLGMGLDQKAVDAVRQYKFKPAMYQGHPVAVQLVIEVDFRLH
jgi:periplasmic protein TonB